MSAVPQTAVSTADKLDVKKILPIIFIVFIDLMGLTIIIPILPYYTLSFDAPAYMIGLVGAAYPLMQLIGGPIMSSLSDRYGRKPILALAQLGTFLSLITLGFANALWLIFVARIMDGITGANLPTVQAAITDQTTPKTRSQGLGLIGAAFGLGFILGPVISGVALSLSGNNYSAPAFVAAGFALLSVFLTTFVFKETLPPEKRETAVSANNPRLLSIRRMREWVQHPVVGVLFVLIFFQQLVFAAFQLMFAPFTLNRLGLNSVGNTIIFAFIGVISVLVQGVLIGKLTNRFGERRLIIAGFGLVGGGMLLMSATPQQPVPWYSQAAIVAELQQQQPETTVVTSENAAQLPLLPPEVNLGISAFIFLLIAQIPIIVGASVLQPSINSLITQRVSPTQVGAALGVSAAFASLSNVLGPLWGGAAFDFLAPSAPFLIGGVAALLLMPLALLRLQPSDGAQQTAVFGQPGQGSASAGD